MKSIVNPKKNPFRNKLAAELFNKMKLDSNVLEYGIDTKGKIYFHFANGNIERYSRSQFIKLAEPSY